MVAAEIHVPELGESVADATVGRWLKQEGDAVSSGCVRMLNEELSGKQGVFD